MGLPGTKVWSGTEDISKRDEGVGKKSSWKNCGTRQETEYSNRWRDMSNEHSSPVLSPQAN
jgi:hypothetical protein